MGRRENALHSIDLRQGKGLELGPLYNPLVRKDEADIFYLDHMSTEGLRKKYADDPLPLEDIVNVDYVLKGTLKQTLKDKKFDYIIASHVIEHIPDVVRWLQDIESVLKNDGILSLVIPDKRFTFDVVRNESRPADIMGAYLDKYTKASSVMMYDCAMECRNDVVPQQAWSAPYHDYREHTPNLSFEEAYKKCQDNLMPDNYVDSHCYVFTPHSFFEIIKNLIKHDLFGYEVVYFCDTPQNELEFYVSFRKSKANQEQKLKTLPILKKPQEKWELERQVDELGRQLHSVLASRSWRLTKPLRIIIAVTKRWLSSKNTADPEAL